jgi:hypothetical protein
VLPEPLVIEDKVGGGINGGVEIETEENDLPAAPQIFDGTN